MPIAIKSLSGISTLAVAAIFNEAFSDYIVPLKLTEQQMADKIKSENIQLDKSVGVFEEEKLVGFILIGIDTVNGVSLAYNAGTGVIPSYWGNQFTQKIYAYLLPALQQDGIVHHQLEVITTNTKAFAVYEKIGFSIARKLTCFKGTITGCQSLSGIIIEQADENCMNSDFWDSEPTWQNSMNAIKRDAANHLFFSATSNNIPVGYLVYTPLSGRVKQFAVDKKYRNRGIGQAMFHYLHQQIDGKDISIINVDDADASTINFLKKIGLATTVFQYEMKKLF